MLLSRRLDVPRARVLLTDDMTSRLLSSCVLHRNDAGRLEFGHQSLLDVLCVGAGERAGRSLLSFIRQLPPVPFVRPAIRSYLAYLSSGDRKRLRGQIRAVFDSDVAFHIKRLVAESLAESDPDAKDWPLLLHAFRSQRALFDATYGRATSLAWHRFWLDHFVPFAEEERDAQCIESHARRIAHWKKSDAAVVLAFWLRALGQDWVDRERIASSISYELRDFDSSRNANALPLIEALLAFPRREHDFLGVAVRQCVESGCATDDLLWHYGAGDLTDEDVRQFRFDRKLRCSREEFRDPDFLARRMSQSQRLLDLAVDAIEQWSVARGGDFSSSREWEEGYLRETSYSDVHSCDNMRHVSAERVLFDAVEGAISRNADEQSDWWTQNRERLCVSREGSLRYFALVALTRTPQENTEQIARVAADVSMLALQLVIRSWLFRSMFLFTWWVNASSTRFCTPSCQCIASTGRDSRRGHRPRE